MARQQFRFAAGAGDGEAMVQIAAMSEPEEAVRWLKRASDLGYAPAMNHLADMVMQHDPVEALSWLCASVALSGDDATRKRAAALAEEMSAAEIEQAQKIGKRFAKELTRPQEGVWAMGASPYGYDFNYFNQCFGGPNNWRLTADGKLIKDIETEECRAAVGFVRELVAAGYFHPDQMPSQSAADTGLVAGKFALRRAAWSNYVNLCNRANGSGTGAHTNMVPSGFSIFHWPRPGLPSPSINASRRSRYSSAFS